MSAEPPSSNHDRQARLLALAAEVRPELHRYCARLMGSVIDGEDIVQDTLLRALVALQDLEETPPLRPWLFRVAHNRKPRRRLRIERCLQPDRLFIRQRAYAVYGHLDER